MTNARPLQPSRRGLMIAMAGGAAASGIAIPALASEPHPDAELIGLGLRLAEARGRLYAAADRAQVADDLFDPPSSPVILIAMDIDVSNGFPVPEVAHCVRGRTWSARQIEGIRAAVPHRAYLVPGGSQVCARTAQRKAEILTAYDAHRAARLAARDACGLTAAEAEYDACSNEVDGIVAAILTARATTLEGLTVKAQAHVARCGVPSAGDMGVASDESLALSIIVDLLAMGAAA